MKIATDKLYDSSILSCFKTIMIPYRLSLNKRMLRSKNNSKLHIFIKCIHTYLHIIFFLFKSTSYGKGSSYK